MSRPLALACICALVALVKAQPSLENSCATIETTGGAPAGSICKFPFVYRGVEFHSCTTADSREKRLWCGTEDWGTQTGPITSGWGYCNEELCKEIPVILEEEPESKGSDTSRNNAIVAAAISFAVCVLVIVGAVLLYNRRPNNTSDKHNVEGTPKKKIKLEHPKSTDAGSENTYALAQKRDSASVDEDNGIYDMASPNTELAKSEANYDHRTQTDQWQTVQQMIESRNSVEVPKVDVKAITAIAEEKKADPEDAIVLSPDAPKPKLALVNKEVHFVAL